MRRRRASPALQCLKCLTPVSRHVTSRFRHSSIGVLVALRAAGLDEARGRRRRSSASGRRRTGRTRRRPRRGRPVVAEALARPSRSRAGTAPTRSTWPGPAPATPAGRDRHRVRLQMLDDRPGERGVGASSPRRAPGRRRAASRPGSATLRSGSCTSMPPGIERYASESTVGLGERADGEQPHVLPALASDATASSSNDGATTTSMNGPPLTIRRRWPRSIGRR